MMCTEIELSPGKFEGQPCIAKVAYEWRMNGMADEHGDTEDDSPDIFNGPFSDWDVRPSGNWEYKMCEECQQDVLHASQILLYEDGQGFVTVRVRGDDREE